MRPHLRIRQDAGGQVRQGLIARPLGHQVDRPADATDPAIGKGGRSHQDIDLRDAFKRTAAGVGQIRQPVEQRVKVGDGKAADEEGIALAEGGGVLADRRIVRHEIAKADRLLVLDQGLGKARDAERCRLRVAVPKRAKPDLGRHLAACIGRGGRVDGPGAQVCRVQRDRRQDRGLGRIGNRLGQGQGRTKRGRRDAQKQLRNMSDEVTACGAMHWSILRLKKTRQVQPRRSALILYNYSQQSWKGKKNPPRQADLAGLSRLPIADLHLVARRRRQRGATSPSPVSGQHPMLSA